MLAKQGHHPDMLGVEHKFTKCNDLLECGFYEDRHGTDTIVCNRRGIRDLMHVLHQSVLVCCT